MMRRFMQSLAMALLCSLPAFVQAQVTNGNFETQYTIPPQGRNNVAGTYQTYDDLPGWRAVTLGLNGGSADYMATNSNNPIVNPQGAPSGYGGNTFLPHSGRGCVVINREPFSYGYDQFITQPVTLTPNHTYQASFYVLRNPGAISYEQVLFAVSSAAPTGFTAGSYTSQYQTLTPAPYASFTSAPITSALTWELVTGTFIAQTNSSHITIGYGPTFGQENPSGNTGIAFAIDDVSLVDMGCIPPVAPSATRTYPQYEDCYRVANYLIDNYDPNLSYTVNWVYNATPFPAHPITGTSSSSGTPGTFFVKGGGNGTGNPVSGRFTITATNVCGSTTSDIIEVEYACDGPTPGYRAANSVSAYPNPATESITIPEGVEGAALINDKGKTLQRADASGKLDVQSLPDGLYNLQMMQNGKLINQRIQVKH